jgi:hypothetical protein
VCDLADRHVADAHLGPGNALNQSNHAQSPCTPNWNLALRLITMARLAIELSERIWHPAF